MFDWVFFKRLGLLYSLQTITTNMLKQISRPNGHILQKFWKNTKKICNKVRLHENYNLVCTLPKMYLPQIISWNFL